jgi:hypothetical protein
MVIDSSTMTDADRAWHATWRPATGHPGGYRVCREFFAPLISPAGRTGLEEANGPSGKLRLFKTRAAAQRAADRLNKP